MGGGTVTQTREEEEEEEEGQTMSLQNELCANAYDGNKELVLRKLREFGATPNGEGTAYRAGRTPLVAAAGSGRKQGEDVGTYKRDLLGSMEALLDAGADANLPQSKDGVTPLCAAVKGGHGDRVGLLLRRGADPGLANLQSGESPLSLAAAGGHQQIVEALVKAGADPLPALQLAAEQLVAAADSVDASEAVLALECLQKLAVALSEAFLASDGLGHLMPVLCHPAADVRSAAAGAVAAACRHQACAEAMVAYAKGGMAKRLVALLAEEHGIAQAHAASALGRAATHQMLAVKDALEDSAEVSEVLAILAASKDATLAPAAASLLQIAAPDAPASKLRERGLKRMFERPWPSSEFNKYKERRGWTAPDPELADHPDGAQLVGCTVFVEGEGEGKIVGFQKSKVGASKHDIEFALRGLQAVALRRKGNDKRPWLVPPAAGATPARLPWQRNGGSAMTTRMYTRGASKSDVCMWLHGEAGVCRHYAGLFDWMIDAAQAQVADDAGDGAVAGTILLDMATASAHGRMLKMYVTIESHRKVLLAAIAGLAGFLGRYLLLPGPCVHTSATCVLILAEDRRAVNEDGTLRKVALKCMKNRAQFLTELRMREGLDGTKVMGALRVHVPPGFAVAAAPEPIAITEPEPETQEESAAHAPVEATVAPKESELFGVEVLRDDTLANAGAASFDSRLTGEFIIVMDCADCDLGSDISHGHYAGRNKTRVQDLLRQVIACFKYCEEQQFAHGDIKPLNLVVISKDSSITIKLIDFDASAKHGELCHLKFSSAFAPPQLAAELLAYESSTGRKPTDADAPMPWAEWLRPRGSLKASVATDMWAFGILAFKLCVEDGASMFLSSEADNIVHTADVEALAYFWNQHSLKQLARVVWDDARDMIFKCLQAAEASRPQSFGELLQHPFLDEKAEMRYFPEPVAARAQSFHAAIERSNAESVSRQLQAGGIHVMLVDESRTPKGVRATPLMRAAFTGDASIARVLLGEVEDSWPDEVRRDYLDQRTSLGFTAHMIACACGHEEIARQFEAKGCSTALVNKFGKTGAALLQATRNEHGRSTCESLESWLSLADHKAIVMSCPEMGTLNPDGSGPYDQKVMDKINELRQRGRLKGGFDRAGSSNMDPRDDEMWPKIFKTAGKEDLFETDQNKRKMLIKSTYWFTGYRTAAKAQMNLECQTFNGTLEVVCIKGGPITDVEHDEMDRIIEEARHDATKNEIQTNIQLKKVSYYEFLCEYDPESLPSKNAQQTELEPELEPELASREEDIQELRAATDKDFVDVSIAEFKHMEQRMEDMQSEATAKDQELVAKDQELAAKDQELAAKDQELEQLRAQLARLEGVPPQRGNTSR